MSERHFHVGPKAQTSVVISDVMDFIRGLGESRSARNEEKTGAHANTTEQCTALSSNHDNGIVSSKNATSVDHAWKQ